MGNGGFEWRFGGSAFRIDMDPLHVAGGLAKFIDHLLSNGFPITGMNLSANAGLQFGKCLAKGHGDAPLINVWWR